MTDDDKQTTIVNNYGDLRVERQPPQISSSFNSRLQLNSRNHLQVKSISYVISKTVSVTQSYNTLLCLAILGYSLAIQKKRKIRFYQGFQSFFGKLKSAEALGSGYTRNINESTPKPIHTNGLWLCFFAAAASFFNRLGERSACFILLTTHSQRVESRWSARQASNYKKLKIWQRLFIKISWEWLYFFSQQNKKGRIYEFSI